MKIKRLRNLREDNDYTQSDIAKILNITRPQYNLYYLQYPVLLREELLHHILTFLYLLSSSSKNSLQSLPFPASIS